MKKIKELFNRLLNCLKKKEDTNVNETMSKEEAREVLKHIGEKYEDSTIFDTSK